MPDRLALSDDSLLPVQAFFNVVGDDAFVRVIDSLTNGVGYTINDCSCFFPGDLNPGDEVFGDVIFSEGVLFSLFEEIVVISKDELADYIRQVSKGFLEKFPAEEDRVKKILSRL